jgi:hypothetical protein
MGSAGHKERYLGGTMRCSFEISHSRTLWVGMRCSRALPARCVPSSLVMFDNGPITTQTGCGVWNATNRLQDYYKYSSLGI